MTQIYRHIYDTNMIVLLNRSTGKKKAISD